MNLIAKELVKHNGSLRHSLKLCNDYTNNLFDLTNESFYELAPKFLERILYPTKLKGWPILTKLFLRLVGRFPQGYGIIFSHGTIHKIYEYAIVNSLRPSSYNTPKCRVVTRNGKFTSRGVDKDICEKINPYFSSGNSYNSNLGITNNQTSNDLPDGQNKKYWSSLDYLQSINESNIWK